MIIKNLQAFLELVKQEKIFPSVEFDFENQTLGDNDVENLADALKKVSITKIQLNLTGNKITSQGLKHLMNALSKIKAQEVRLDFSDNQINSAADEQDSERSRPIKAFANFIKNQKVTYLNL